MQSIKLFFILSLAQMFCLYPNLNQAINWPVDPLIKKNITEKEEDFFLQHRPIIISLGDSCQPAINLTWNKLRFMAYPFDWAVTRFDDLYDIIQTDFNNCKEQEYYSLAWDPETKNIRPTNKYYPNLQFPHAKWDNLVVDLNRRIERFYKTIKYAEKHNKKISFIIHSNLFKDDSIKIKAQSLNDLLSNKFPKLNFILIVMHHADIPNNFKNDKSIFCRLNHLGWDQQSYAEWKNIFLEIGLINTNANNDSIAEHPFQ